MSKTDPFLLQDFVPYLLNQAAEATSLEVQKYYKANYGMLRTEWRVLFHLGRYGRPTAKVICTRVKIHNTKVSHAVTALEARRFLTRTEVARDRRHEMLSLTPKGRAAFDDLVQEALRYNTRLMAAFTKDERATVQRFLLRMVDTA